MPSSSITKTVITEKPVIRYTLIILALAYIALFLVLPLATVFSEALKKGFQAYFQALARRIGRDSLQDLYGYFTFFFL